MIKRSFMSNKWLILFVVSSIVFSGCNALGIDITPPPEENSAGQNPTSQPTRTPAQEAVQPAATLSQEELEDEVVVHIIDQTGGLLVEQGLEVELIGYENFELVYEAVEKLTSDNWVLFEDAPFQEGRVYFASISYGGAIYRSEIVELGAETTYLELSIQVYDTTTSDENLVIDRVHLLADFPSENIAQIVEIFIVSNLGDSTVVASEPGEATISFSLPADAESIEFENGEIGQRYLQTEDGFGDTVSIPPGSGVYQVLVYYQVPIQRSIIKFSQEMRYPVQAVVVMTPAGEAVLKGSNLEDEGTQAIPDGSMQIYSGAALARGESLEFRLTVESETSTLTADDANFLSRGVVIGAGVLGGVIFLVGLWLFISRRGDDLELAGDSDLEENTDQILDSIIALEDLYKEGQIEEKDYLEKRQELKDKLAAIEEQE